MWLHVSCCTWQHRLEKRANVFTRRRATTAPAKKKSDERLRGFLKLIEKPLPPPARAGKARPGKIGTILFLGGGRWERGSCRNRKQKLKIYFPLNFLLPVQWHWGLDGFLLGYFSNRRMPSSKPGNSFFFFFGVFFKLGGARSLRVKYGMRMCLRQIFVKKKNNLQRLK